VERSRAPSPVRKRDLNAAWQGPRVSAPAVPDGTEPARGCEPAAPHTHQQAQSGAEGWVGLFFSGELQETLSAFRQRLRPSFLPPAMTAITSSGGRGPPGTADRGGGETLEQAAGEE